MCDENRKLVSAEKTEQNIEIAIIDERTIRNKIYEVRGVKVMLDFEIAEIYGYTTSRFNEQVSNNIEKFKGDDFCFYLTQEEFAELKNMISKKSTSSWGGTQKASKSFYREWSIYVDDGASRRASYNAKSCTDPHLPYHEGLHSRYTRISDAERLA